MECGKKFNVGICWLKVLACFGVVNSHYGVHIEGEVAALPVPVFIFCSIYIAYPALKKNGLNKLLDRLWRLLLPFWCWGIVYFILYSLHMKCIVPSKLIWQLTFGHSVCKPLFFLPLLGMITIVAYALSRFRRGFMLWSIFLIVFSLCMQHTGLNYRIFCDYPDEMRWTCGRFLEVLPVAIGACLLSTFLQSRKHNILWLCVAISTGLIVLFLFNLHYRIIPRCEGFTKQGLGLFLGSIGIGSLFIAIGELLLKKGEESILVRMSRLMFGVYLLHVLAAQFFELIFKRQHSLVESAVVFSVSLVVAGVLSKFRYIKKVIL